MNKVEHQSFGNVFVFFLMIFIHQCSSGYLNKKNVNSPNIILIIVDDWGWTDAGFMGSTYYETPNLDQLAREGMVFTHAYAGAANCAPSRACILSGRNTPWHGVFTVSPSARGHEKTRQLVPIRNTPHLDTSVYTLHRMMKSAGYVTSNFGKWHLGADPTRQGVDVNVGGSGRGNPGRNGYFSPYNIDYIEDGPAGEYLTDRLTNEAIRFLDRFQDTSFFLYVPYYTVHTPIIGKPEWIAHYEKKTGENGHTLSEYAAMISSMDENVGRLIKHLKRLEMYDDCLFILTSDNGGLLQVTKQYPLRAGKGSYYEGGIRIPLVMKWKGHIPGNSQNQTNVSHLDFYPTLQQIVRPAIRNDSLDGKDLTPLFEGVHWPDRTLFFHFPVYLQASQAVEGLRDPLFRTRPGSVIIDGKWKLHHYFEDNGLELFDLESDPSESNNLVETNPNIRDALYGKLMAWREQNRAPVPIERNLEYDQVFERARISEKIGTREGK